MAKLKNKSTPSGLEYHYLVSEEEFQEMLTKPTMEERVKYINKKKKEKLNQYEENG